MARIEETLYTYLTNASRATYALIGTRLYPVLADQAATLPFVVFTRENEERANAFGTGFVPGLAETDITFEIHAKSPEKADQIADALYSDLMGKEAQIGCRGVLFGRNRHGVAWLPDAYMVEADYTMWWAVS